MMGTKRNCGGDSDHIQAKMNGSNLALERIVTVPPPQGAEPLQSRSGTHRVVGWGLGWSVHTMQCLGRTYNCWVWARPTVQTLFPTRLCHPHVNSPEPQLYSQTDVARGAPPNTA